MALTLTVGGTNFLSQYKTGSAQIREQLNNKGNTLSLIIIKRSGGSVPSEGTEIIFKDGSRFLFAGYVSRVEPLETGKGDLFEYQVEATDYTYIIINKIAQKTYTNQTLRAIVLDLLSTYVDSGYALTTTHVQTGPTINTISFNYIPLRKCFEKLAQVSGYEWYIDYEKDIHFFEKETTFAPEDITDSSSNFSFIQIKRDTTQIRNSVIVKGGREETTTNFSQDFLGDGEAREWILREKPKTMVSIELNTGAGFVTQTYAVDPIDEDTGNNFMFNYQEKFVRCASGQTTPSATDILRITYKYEVPVIVKLKENLSIAAMKVLEGGDGVHEYVITDLAVKSKAEARLRALKEIEEYGNPLITAVFETRTGLLQSGSVFAPGQILTVNLPTWGISTDTDYIIQQVDISLVEDGTTIEYNYRVTFGGRLIGVKEFLESLAGKEEVILDTEELDRIEAVSEDVNITETVARNPLVRSVAESATIAETTPSQSKTTPPFRWAPSATKKAIWGKFEWS